MAMNLAAVRTAIKNALGPLDLNVYDYQKLRPTLPAAVVMLPPTINPRLQLGGTSMLYRIPVQFMIGFADDLAADDAIEVLLAESGEGSAVAVLRADRTLGGACESCEIVDISGGTVFEFLDASIVCLTYTITVEVMT